jgi:hypothetical protein
MVQQVNNPMEIAMGIIRIVALLSFYLVWALSARSYTR